MRSVASTRMSSIQPSSVPPIRTVVLPTRTRWGSTRRYSNPPGFAEGFFWCATRTSGYALAHAYNDWMADLRKTAPQRLLAAAILPLRNAEPLDRAPPSDFGFRVIGLDRIIDDQDIATPAGQ